MKPIKNISFYMTLITGIFFISKGYSQTQSIDTIRLMQKELNRRHIRIPIRQNISAPSESTSPLSSASTVIGTNVDASNMSGPQSECFITIDPNNQARVLA